MLNERKRVEEILKGENLDPYKMRTMCRLLTRYYLEQGVDDPKEIRRLIFSWANSHKLYIKLSVKHLIAEEMEIYRPLGDVSELRVSRQEIEAISLLSKKKTVRRAMVGILCYGKVFGIDNVIDINIKDFCEWIGYNGLSNFYNYALKEMLAINFVRDVNDNYAKWENGHITKCTRKLYINFGLDSKSGEYILKDDDFKTFYDTIVW